MAECFVLLRGTPDGPAYLAWIEAPDYADAWTPNKADARHFTDHDDAETMQADIVARQEIAVAVVPDYIRRARTARATRVGPGPDRPRVHGA